MGEIQIVRQDVLRQKIAVRLREREEQFERPDNHRNKQFLTE